MLDVMLHNFDDDNGIVHHQTDGQHQAEERQRVDGKPEQRKQRERADQRHRHGQQRNQRRAPALQEEEDDDDDEDQSPRTACVRFPSCPPSRPAWCPARRHNPGPAGSSPSTLSISVLGAVGGIDGVGTGQLVERDQRARPAVEPRQHVVVLRAEFHARHVLHPHDGSARRRARRTMFPNSSCGLQPALRARRRR